MEDIEDVLGPAGLSGGGAPPGLRIPLSATVAVKPKRKSSRVAQTPEARIPGTQTIYVKTFGCSHNQSDSEYMAGQLSSFGYDVVDLPEGADLWLINTCTVKNPSQSAMTTLITKCKSANKPLVVAGCVPQGSQGLKELEGISIIGVQQIDRVVEVVEETLKGHEVRLLSRKTLPSLDLPKVRKNKFIEILPINVGCLGACTYCKTKHARGHLGSYTIESLVDRVKIVASEGVREIWLSSEDTGAYGRDIGTNLPNLLNAIVAELPVDRSTMLRIGMTNPPFILEHLKEIAAVLRHPCVYSFLHVPVQSGSDAVLTAMNREYTVGEFRKVVDTLCELVPGMQIATDIICGFPGETDEDFAQTVELVKEYKFSQVHISQFYPRPGTPAARMKKVPSHEVKKRSRELTSVFESFSPYQGMEGTVERIWITEIATDGVHLVGHTKGYIQVLVIAPDSMLGTSADVKITSVGRWSVFGEVIEGSVAVKEAPKKTSTELQMKCRENQVEEASCCTTDSCGSCACSEAAQHCGAEQCDVPPDATQARGDATRLENVPLAGISASRNQTTMASLTFRPIISSTAGASTASASATSRRCHAATRLRRRLIVCKAEPSGGNSSLELAAGAVGLASCATVAWSLYTLKTTGCGLPPGPGGSLGAAEGVSYLVVAALVGWSLTTKVRTGSGLPAGPYGLLGAAEGVAYLTIAAIVVVFGLQFFQQGFIPGPLPSEQCFG